ncbi:MAG: SIR2 family protein [Dehalococcoides mccartyi]|jgi:hypothetical protein|uniref:SIR2 family protein n=1 Tax=Dehalococcoides TaxID=61434 RepID=UPI0027379FC8|nr:SIR2 family protein [Dehalococcoides mccartyi]MDP4279512.1 SIR2 family protein [Dehalococcoides mccartyi]
MDTKTKTFIRNYAKALKENNAAIFAGSGLSKESGFVDWRGLLRHIAEDLHLDVDKEQDLVALTQYHINEKGGNRSTINQALLEEFTRGSTKTENHKIIASLPISTFWTTNYDKLIEEALCDEGKTPDIKVYQDDLSTNLPKRDAIVYKMHGDISHPSDVVISKDDYEIYNLNRPLFSAALQGDLVSKTFLFIGFSFNDPNLDQILGRIRVLLGKNLRQHYCFFKKVNRGDYDSDEDFQYNSIKQGLRINDLKRYAIEGILVDDYSQIPQILTNIRDSFRRNIVFISGSADDYGEWGMDNALKFVHALSYRLAAEDYKLVSGFGRGIGSTIINGCLEYVYSSQYRHLDSYLDLRPFPQIITGKKPQETLWKEYRRDMISNAGIAIFLFGNKMDEDNKLIDAPGLQDEFEMAKELGLKIVPVGATGFVSEKLWKDIFNNYNHFYTGYSQLKTDFEILGSKEANPDVLVNTIVKIVNILRGG